MIADAGLWWAKYRSDPLAFVADYWPAQRLAPYQGAILESVAANPETFVYSGHKLGKTFTAAMAALWFFLTRKSRVYLIARTQDNLETALWPGIVRLLNSASVRDPASDLANPRPLLDSMGHPVASPFKPKVKQNHLQLHVIEQDGGVDQNCFVRGFLQNVQEALAGQHAPRMAGDEPTVLVIVDEASNQEPWLYETVSAYAHRLLMIGNPIHGDGVFYEKCKAGDEWHRDEDRPEAPAVLYRKVIHVSAEDSPNVKLGRARAKHNLAPIDIVPGILGYADYKKFSKIWPASKRRWGLDGLFPDETTNRLFPEDWLELAHALCDLLRRHNAELKAKGRRPKLGYPFGLGIDCGRSAAGDMTSFTVVGRYGWVHSESAHIADTSVVYKKVIALARRFKIRSEFIAFDSAIGGPISDLLNARKGWETAAVNFGSREHIDTERFANMRASLYGEVAAAMELKYRTANDGTSSKRLKGQLRKMLDTPPDQWPKSWQCVAIPREETELCRELKVLPRQHSHKNGALLLPPKERRDGRRMRPGEFCLRDLLGRSPDRGDSFVLGYYGLQRGLEIRDLSRCDHPLIY
jgi:hypothetical protein